MTNFIATPARIRRVSRAFEFPSASDAGVKANRPDAQDGNDRVINSRFDNSNHAQLFLNDRFAELKRARRREQIETNAPFNLGRDVAIVPSVPRVRLKDRLSNLDAVFMIKAVAIDFNSGLNSIEVIG
jgi:hypothetical protein